MGRPFFYAKAAQSSPEKKKKKTNVNLGKKNFLGETLKSKNLNVLNSRLNKNKKSKKNKGPSPFKTGIF